jgi:polysaccharide biosynthesis transport protein
MNIKAYISPLIKYWWLILAAGLVAVVSSYYVTKQQPPVYQSKATLIVGRAFYDANPSGNDLYLSQQLATYYADIGQRSEVYNAVQEELGLSWLPQYRIRPLPNSQMLEIVVADTNPTRAQAVANELANQLIKISPTSDQSQGQDRQIFINDQISYLEEKILETREELEKAEKQLTELTSAREISDMRTRINAFQTKLSQLQSNYASLISNTQQGAVNTLRIVERASLPTWPVSANSYLTILLAGVIAAVIAASAAYLLEFLDDTFKSSDEVAEVLQIPVMGRIPMVGKHGIQNAASTNKYTQGLKGILSKLVPVRLKDYSYRVYAGNPNGHGSSKRRAMAAEKAIDDPYTFTSTHPRSTAAEEFRLLRVNLEFASVDNPLKKIYITSTSANEGKTSIAVNLAIVMAQGGKKVILLDADMRRPSVNHYLNISNKKGLSDLLRSDIDLSSVIQPWSESLFSVITTGLIPPNPADLLTSKKMDQVLRLLEEAADIVIIDGPPMSFPDSVSLSKKAEGVLMVVTYGFTRKNPALKILKQLEQIGARVVGIVFNKVPYRTLSNYNYGYYSEYYETGSPAEPEPETVETLN